MTAMAIVATPRTLTEKQRLHRAPDSCNGQAPHHCAPERADS